MAWGIFRPFSWLGRQFVRPFKYLAQHAPEIAQGLGVVAFYASEFIPQPLLRNLVKQVGRVALEGDISGEAKMGLVLAGARLAAYEAGMPFDEQKYRAIIELLVAELKG